jgi:phospholipase/carboxylesterase
MTYLPCVEIETNPQVAAVASIIWLHGLGADGNDFAALVPELHLPEKLALRFIFPHAPMIPVTINGGYVMPAWYDILEANLDRKVDALQLAQSASAIQLLIDREIARGVESQKIILAGFSQGGAVVYEAGLSYTKPLAGMLALSTYLATNETLKIHPSNQQTPIVIQHGTLDPVVNESLGQRAFRQLSDRGCNVSYESYEMEHALCVEQIQSLVKWILYFISDK